MTSLQQIAASLPALLFLLSSYFLSHHCNFIVVITVNQLNQFCFCQIESICMFVNSKNCISDWIFDIQFGLLSYVVINLKVQSH